MANLLVITPEEQSLRLDKLRRAMSSDGIECALLSDNASIFYLTGRVFSGYVFIPEDDDTPVYLVKRPIDLEGDRVCHIRKPENIPGALAEMGITLPSHIGLELSAITYTTAIRLQKALEAREIADVSPSLAIARSTKTPHEINLIRLSGAKHERVYRRIPLLYRPGMTDIELQVEIERLSRLEGCLGQFRIAGSEMELHMGNVLVGNNADSPSPYDFAMGGAGAHPSLPVGASGTPIVPGTAVMVDMNGNFTGYMTDMTRTFRCGKLPLVALDAHRLSIDICEALAELGHPGAEARALYDTALEMARKAGFEDFFMGHRQKAGFVGHGIGIQVNELPVIAPRSCYILAEGNVIALEPKFVIPGVGAVGIENTYAVTSSGPMECLTRAPEDLLTLE